MDQPKFERNLLEMLLFLIKVYFGERKIHCVVNPVLHYNLFSMLFNMDFVS